MGRPKGSKNKSTLVKRTPVAAPKPLPAREKEEPETTTCTVQETPKSPWVPTLGFCKSCSKNAAHSLVDKLCYNCHKEAEGFTFDGEKKRWVKPEKRKK